MTNKALLSVLALAAFSAVNAGTNPITGREVVKLDTTQTQIPVTQFTVGSTTYTVISGDATLAGNKEYVLDNVTFVENGTLTIEAGCIVRGELRSAAAINDPGTLVITRSGRINAQGSSTSPIIFTTAALNNAGSLAATTTVTGSVAATFVVTNFSTSVVNNNANATFAFWDSNPISSPLMPINANLAGFAAAEGSAPYSDGPVVNELENRGLWGGVIVLGKSTTNNGAIVSGVATGTTAGDLGANFLDNYFEGFIEGLNTVDIGQRGVYGGRNPNDDSGVISYVSIRHGGSILGGSNEINGLTLGGVGRGTQIDHVEVYSNLDDGFEFFGGSVDATHLISLFNYDDSIDVDEGYTGRLQFIFSLSLDDTINSDHGLELDGVSAAHDSIGVDGGTNNNDNGVGIVPAFLVMYNGTFIGGGDNGALGTESDQNNAIRMRDSFGGFISNSIFSDFRHGGYVFEADNAARVTAGDVQFYNNMFYGNAAPFADAASVQNTTATGATASVTLSNFETNNNSFDVDPFDIRRNGAFDPFTNTNLAASFSRRGGIDPRADSNDPSGLGLNTYPATFFNTVGYKGAFDPDSTETWADSWSVFGTQFLAIQQ